MADTHKDLDYLRFFHTSEDSLKDKDILKTEAHAKYGRNVSTIFALPAALQCGQIHLMNKPGKQAMYNYIRSVKWFALMGGVAVAWNEKV